MIDDRMMFFSSGRDDSVSPNFEKTFLVGTDLKTALERAGDFVRKQTRD